MQILADVPCVYVSQQRKASSSSGVAIGMCRLAMLPYFDLAYVVSRKDSSHRAGGPEDTNTSQLTKLLLV